MEVLIDVLPDTLGNVLLLGLGQLRKNRKRNHLSGGLFRNWQRPLPVAQVGVTFLQVQGDGVVDFRADAF